MITQKKKEKKSVPANRDLRIKKQEKTAQEGDVILIRLRDKRLLDPRRPRSIDSKSGT